MNSKKNKHKNRPNKPPNPNPPQNIVETQVKTDVSIEYDKQILPEGGKRVPEIISEVTPQVDIEIKPEEQPKKPKRSRGKKNQQEKVSVETTSYNPEPELQQEELQYEYQEVKNENEKNPEGIPYMPEVTPSVRKTKNKNKKASENESKNNENAEVVAIEEKKAETVINKSENIITISKETTTEEMKHKKKNKKKKNRNDSEKSDKEDQVSCVTAFQKLIRDEKPDDKVATKSITSDQEITKIVQSKTMPVNEPISHEPSVGKVLDSTTVLSSTLPTDRSTDLPKKITGELTKNKKKNKKEKKNPPRKDDKLDTQTIPTIDTKNDIELVEQSINVESSKMLVPTDEMIVAEPLRDVTKFEDTMATEQTKKSNVKIAKPVDKKGKDKTRDQKRDMENDNDAQDKKTIESLEYKSQDVKIEQLLFSTYEEKCTNDQCSQLKAEVDKLITSASIGNEKIESQSKVLEDASISEMGKEKITSPDLVKLQQSHTKVDFESNKYEKDTKVIQETEDIKKDSNLPKTDINQETVTVHKCEEKLAQRETLEKEQKGEMENQQIEEDNKNLKTKTQKRRKKSPRPSTDVKLITDGEKVAFPVENFPVNDDHNIVKKTIDNVSHYRLPGNDIEIRSLHADESEESICGATPDLIEYPRATSQDLIDKNNNMTAIQEFSMADGEKLNIPFNVLDTPFIKGSGETPTTPPELIIINKNPIDAECKPENSCEVEKTDVKSKMMEVNQDMEDLRLSIEKSLAELTAIEKCEEKFNKDYEAQKPSSPNETKAPLDAPCEPLIKPILEPKILDDLIELSTQKILVIEETNTIKICEIENVEEPEKLNKQKVSIIESKNPILTTEIPKVDNILSVQNTESLKLTDNKLLSGPAIAESSRPICPTRKDQKHKGKNKKKGKHEHPSVVLPSEAPSTVVSTESKKDEKEPRTEQKSEDKSKMTQENSKQQHFMPSVSNNDSIIDGDSSQIVTDFDPIENFEDAMTSSADDVNKSFEIIANETNHLIESSHVNPEINITVPVVDSKNDKKDDKINPVSQPKNLLGHSGIPAPSNKIDYKKEKNKTPTEITAKVKIKDAISIETNRESKESQTDNIKKFMKNKSIDESFSVVTNEDDDFVYKYSFRKVFLQSACHVCKKELKQSRVPCSYCNLIFYCSTKHKDEDWSQHQAFCFAISTIVHLKDQKHIYADAKDVKGQNYRLLRMQMIVSCEKVLKRRLAPWEQEALLYPRICAESSCREWRQNKLLDCEGCGQISFCTDNPDHIPKLHQRWCKSYSLYQKLVCYQQTKGRLEPMLPSKVMMDYQIPDKLNDVLASMYEEKIDMNDIQYAALTQIATAPLTAAYAYQTFIKQSSLPNGILKKSTMTIHVVGAELQFEADALDKWEVFFLHVVGARRLRLVLVATDLNPSQLPLDLLSNVNMRFQLEHKPLHV
ncbi:hypothetical protein ACJJTC_007256 [Scirpophaga incertulas]